MGLGDELEGLTRMAQSRAAPDRERLLLALADLCRVGGGAMGEAPVQELLSSVFLSLVVEAERDIRRRLADKLSSSKWAPAALINVLALDEIEIARPIIAASPVLKDQDLIRLLIEATIEHQIEVARRPHLGEQVVAAILEQAEPAVLTALAGNPTADVSDAQMAELVASARRIAALRSPLARHPRLRTELALQLYVWVGQAMRHALADRFRLEPGQLEQALAEAVGEAHGGVTARSDGLVVIARDGQHEEMERNLVAKLHAAGQLRPGYLVRALRDGRLTLFAAALARLGGFEPEQVRLALNSDRPELLALACASVGIDRSAFPSMLKMIRELNAGRPSGGEERARRASGAFGPVRPDVAGAAFRQTARAS